MRFLKAFVIAFGLSLFAGMAWMFGSLYLPMYWEQFLCRRDPNCGGGIGASSGSSASGQLVILIVFAAAFFWSYGGAPRDRFAKTVLLVVGVALLLGFLAQFAPVP